MNDSYIYFFLPNYVTAYLRWLFRIQPQERIVVPEYYPVPWRSMCKELTDDELIQMPTLQELLTTNLVNNVGLYESRHLYPLSFCAKAVEYAKKTKGSVNGHIPEHNQIAELTPFAIPPVIHTSKGWVKSSDGYLTMECKAGARFQKACLQIFKEALKNYLHTHDCNKTSITELVRQFCQHHRFSPDITENAVEAIRQSVYRWGLTIKKH